MINLLYAGNDKMFDGVLTSTLSIVHNLETQTAINVYILSMDLQEVDVKYKALTSSDAKFIENALRKHNKDTNVKVIDVKNLYTEFFKGSPNEDAYCSPYTLLRLFADKVDLPDKFLYLDADTMVLKDIRKLYDIDISNYEYGASNDHYGKFLISYKYINAGVILFNMKECRKTKLFEKARKQIQLKKLVFADQSALIRSTTKFKLLSQRFNDQKFLYKKTVIRHFSKRLFYTPYPHTENIKQWHIDKVHKRFKYTCFDKILEEYTNLKKDYEIMKNKQVNIFFSCDENYISMLGVSMYSLMQNADKTREYNVKILHTNIGEESQKKLLSTVKESCFNVEFYNVSEDIKDVYTRLHTRDYYTQTSYYRLFIPEIFKNLDKALYLDSDIVVLGNIAELYDFELDGNLVAGATCQIVEKDFQVYAKNCVGVESPDYINAGIILMDLDGLRKVNFGSVFTKILEEVKYTVAQDQDYINAILKGRIKRFGIEWNKAPFEVKGLKDEDIKLLHFVIDLKPWWRDNVLYGNYFWDYAKKSAYYEDVLKIRENVNERDMKVFANQTKDLIESAKTKSVDALENERVLKALKKVAYDYFDKIV